MFAKSEFEHRSLRRVIMNVVTMVIMTMMLMMVVTTVILDDDCDGGDCGDEQEWLWR